ncbi:MAG: 2-oxoglutarate/2-oxoacid ferredoxin oxidoreductase subunit alpha, partial [Acidimicrobiaceae bacterium]|nr:2-oxoglutarate/2-oxoacid ferredoxin oxidoreductase subunit alpha [Acidimicrobiaceae bacterium]
MTDTASKSEDRTESLDRVVVRFAGDSGDGMQLTGDRFTSASALFGNDLSTLPEFPAEIRAPAGTVHGVSSFQVHISDHDITTPGDAPNVLVAMNPAALHADLNRLEAGGMVILNIDAFDERNLTKAGYTVDPREDKTLAGYKVIEVPMTSLTLLATEPLGVKARDAERSKNFFALGLISWLYSRPTESTLTWIAERFAKTEMVAAANRAAFLAGHAFGETTEEFDHPYQVKPAKQAPGEYTNVTGNTALAWGLVAAGQLAHLPILLGSYPITPASDILHELAKHKNFGVRTFQAEDEIAAAGSALGAAFAGHLGITTTSGPGVALKSETISLAISLELPMLIVDIQRGGPSTGLPTKTEAADLNLAVYGRHAEAPLPVVAAYSPSHCFHAAIEAVRLAVKYRTPVILLSDGYLANGSEPWNLPDVDTLPDISTPFATETNHVGPDGTPEFWPYLRDPDTLARPWAIPGTPGLAHRVGGLEKEDGTGNISYTPENHERMVHLRAAKIAGIANDIPPVEVQGDADAELLVLGWGSTWGAIDAAVQ